MLETSDTFGKVHGGVGVRAIGTEQKQKLRLWKGKELSPAPASTFTHSQSSSGQNIPGLTESVMPQ